MWFRRPSRTSLPSTRAHPPALRPWGDAAYLSPYHLPLCIEGDAEVVEVAAMRLLADIQAQHIPVFLQEGPRSLVSSWENLPVPQSHVLPPLRPGTTPETVHQTLLEITGRLSVRPRPEAGGWPALLVCSQLGTQRDTVLEVVGAHNRGAAAPLGVIYIYLQGAAHPPPERPLFASQLHCHADGKAVLRRNHIHQRVILEKTAPTLHTPSRVRSARPKSLA